MSKFSTMISFLAEQPVLLYHLRDSEILHWFGLFFWRHPPVFHHGCKVAASRVNVNHWKRDTKPTQKPIQDNLINKVLYGNIS